MVPENPGIEPATPGLQGMALIHDTTAASILPTVRGTSGLRYSLDLYKSPYNICYVNEIYFTSCALVLRGRRSKNASAIRETEHII